MNTPQYKPNGWSKKTQSQLNDLRKTENRYNEPVGHYTGRCSNCGSKDLWDDVSAYGCNKCKAIFFTG